MQPFCSSWVATGCTMSRAWNVQWSVQMRVPLVPREERDCRESVCYSEAREGTWKRRGHPLEHDTALSKQRDLLGWHNCRTNGFRKIPLTNPLIYRGGPISLVDCQFPRTAIGEQELWSTEIRERFVSGATDGKYGYTARLGTMPRIVAGIRRWWVFADRETGWRSGLLLLLQDRMDYRSFVDLFLGSSVVFVIYSLALLIFRFLLLITLFFCE